jgi:hypothetical protein
MPLITAIRQAQIPVLALMLIGASVAKIVPALLPGRAGLLPGPAVLYPARLRRPLVVVLCAVEAALAVSLVITAGLTGRGVVANSVRLATGLLFLLAACALVELRSTRPDLGCGCFGEFSTAPVSLRTLTRSVLLAAAALATVGLGPVQPPRSGALSALTTLGIFVAELAVLAALSPELGVGLIRLGYSEPCEMRTLPAERTMLALRKSAQWRRHAGLITAAEPADVWRELCWRYVVYPSRSAGREAELVFAVYLRPRRPVVLAALVDSVTATVLPWPEVPARPAWLRWLPSSSRQAAPPPAIPVLALAAAAAPVPGTMAAASRGPASDAEAPTDPGLATAAVPADGQGRDEADDAEDRRDDADSAAAAATDAAPEREPDGQPTAERPPALDPAPQPAAVPSARPTWFVRAWRRAPAAVGEPAGGGPAAPEPVSAGAADPGPPAGSDSAVSAAPVSAAPVSAVSAPAASVSAVSAPAVSVPAVSVPNAPVADAAGPQTGEPPAPRPTPWFTPVRSRRS